MLGVVTFYVTTVDHPIASFPLSSRSRGRQVYVVYKYHSVSLVRAPSYLSFPQHAALTDLIQPEGVRTCFMFRHTPLFAKNSRTGLDLNSFSTEDFVTTWLV